MHSLLVCLLINRKLEEKENLKFKCRFLFYFNTFYKIMRIKFYYFKHRSHHIRFFSEESTNDVLKIK
jgi:hypothetical protein